MYPRSIFPSIGGLTLLVIVVFALLKWLEIPTGDVVDWVAGILIFWWLIFVVTVPWNMHFSAKEILAEAKISTQKDIKVEAGDLQYAQRIARFYFWLAIGLHLVSALVLFLAAQWGYLPNIGYIAAGAALLLTLARPLARMYEYVVARLSLIRQRITHPREDVYELRHQLYDLQDKLSFVQNAVNLDDPSSSLSQQGKQLEQLEQTLHQLRVALDDWKVKNEAEHRRLERGAEESIAKLSEDAQFLNQVRELIRFVKQA
ncbi:MAG: hypothetical protein MUC97_04855 [Bernardetiaceae bacterium]|jgi:hypothetical protein|nr:hypothetical protein [Bernardetiaceae bacterium]